MHRLLISLSPLAALGAATAALYWEILFPERILGDYDVWTYFYPLRAYGAAALGAGRFPLWTPEVFLGVPFFANPQTALLYPGTLLFVLAPVPYAYSLSVLAHVFLAGALAYAFARSVLGVRQWPALVAGAAFAFGGAVSAQVGHVNQLSATPWLPLIALCADRAYRTRSWAWAGGGAFGVSIQLLAGHAQITYMTGWVVGLLLLGRVAQQTRPLLSEAGPAGLGWAIARALGVALAIAGPGAAMAGVQLVPTVELLAESIRGGGLSYAEATAFSLPPSLLARAILPGYWANVFSEFRAYLGTAPLLLAALGLAFGRGPQALFCAAVGGLGLLLALGGANPLYPALYEAVPGIDLFRVPARWLLVYSFGVACLAALGLDWACTRPLPRSSAWRPPLVLALVAFVAVLSAFLATGVSGRIVLLWVLGFSGSAALVVLTLWRPSHYLVAGLLLAVLVELRLAGLDLPARDPIPEDAYASVRPLPAYLLETRAGRVLSMAPTEYEVPDYRELAGRYPDLSPAAAFAFKTALKLDEVMSPNTPLRYGLSTVDGYDGGVLPLRRYLDLASLLVPRDDLRPDGVLRTRLRVVPDPHLLQLFGIRGIIASQVDDVEIDGIRFDTATARTLLEAPVRVELPRPISGSEIAILASTPEPVAAPSPGSITVLYANDQADRLPLLTGQHVFWRGAPSGLGAARPRAAGVRADAHDSMSRVPLPSGLPISAIVFDWTAQEPWEIRGVTLLQTDGGQELLVLQPGLQRTFFPPLKLYTREEPSQTVRLVSRAEAWDDPTALAALQADPASAREVVRLAPSIDSPPEQGIGQGDFRRLPGPPEHLAFVRTAGDGSGYLVVDDAWFPGWRARVDGVEAAVYRANGLFKAVWVPTGAQWVDLRYEPFSLRLGAGISLLGLAGAIALVAIGLRRRSL